MKRTRRWWCPQSLDSRLHSCYPENITFSSPHSFLIAFSVKTLTSTSTKRHPFNLQVLKHTVSGLIMRSKAIVRESKNLLSAMTFLEDALIKCPGHKQTVKHIHHLKKASGLHQDTSQITRHQHVKSKKMMEYLHIPTSWSFDKWFSRNFSS